jgi:hypothetical protein
MTPLYANVSDVPLALAVFLASDNYDYDKTPDTISATTLLKPLRQIILPRYIEDGESLPILADQMKNRMGAAIHDGIERAWKYNHELAMTALGYPRHVIDRVLINPDDSALNDEAIPVYLEQRLKRKVGKWTVTGKFDFIGDGKVQDFKSTSTYTYKKQVNAQKYILQGSLYRWLDPVKIHQDQMDIHYIFTDWKASMVRSDPHYPPKSFHTQTFQLSSVAETDAYVRRKLSDIEKYWTAPEEDIPLCSDEDLWRSEPQYKYYKSGDITSKRSTKNFDSRQEAVIYMTTNGNVGAIKEVPGEVTACKYCRAYPVCSQKDQLIAAGELNVGK